MNRMRKLMNAVRRRWAMRNPDSFIKWMKTEGASIGKNFKIAANGPLGNITIDMTRPSLITIGDNVTINKNFTLLTHDFVSGIFLEAYGDFLPSSGKVSIGNNVRFGANCTVLKGVNIGDNCFISAGSVVSTDIPSNSIAAGNPCKVITDIESFYRYRQEACKAEAYLYAQSIYKRYGRKPVPSDFWEEFPLFVNKSNINQYPEIPVKRQLGKAYPAWIENHVSLFGSFDEFIDYALDFNPSKSSEDISSEREMPEEILDKVRVIVSDCTAARLTSAQDKSEMNEIEGWTSLANLMIISKVGQAFGIGVTAADMLKMTSIQSIATVIQSKRRDNRFNNISSLYPHSPLLNAICSNVERNPRKTAVKIGKQVISYSALYENICKAASVLFQLGLRPRDRIVLAACKDPFYIYVYFASHILGITNVIVDLESNSKRLRYIEQKIRPKYCIGYISESCPSKLYADLDMDDADMMRRLPGQYTLSDQDVAEILFTTGTTGAPKGVCLSYASIYGSALNINKYIQNTVDDIELLGLPLCHSFAMGRIRCNLLKGSTIVMINNFGNIQQVFDIIENEHSTGFGMVPAVWEYIRTWSGTAMAKYADQIKYIEIGSAPMRLESKKELLNMFPDTRICMHYGLTEASRACFMEFHDTEHLDSIGKPVCDDVEIRIMNEAGKELPAGEKGEICVKGNMVMLRYLDDNDMENAFHGDCFRTGDCGYMSPDGYIYLSGREKELINVGGKKVSPMEVEEAICSLGVKDCLCVPMEDPENVMGELVKCYVLKGGTDLSFEQISEKLSGKLERYKQPVAYEFIDEIPYTASGKKQRINMNKYD